MAEVEAITGRLELEEAWTSVLELAAKAVEHFGIETVESLKPALAVVGLVTAAFAATSYALIEFGKRGSEINDVSRTLDHFAGSSEKATEILEKMSEGVHGTIDKFELAKEAAHLLGAQVNLTAEEFGTLSAAAFVLQNRGLGTTKDMLELVSNALVTGRTRALAMKLGVQDAGEETEAYAESLGVAASELSKTGQVEATRIHIMEMLKIAVKDAGVQQLDFAEQLERVHASITEVIDDFSSAIAASPVVNGLMAAIGDTMADAFGENQVETIHHMVERINDAVIALVGFTADVVRFGSIFPAAFNIVQIILKDVITGLQGVTVVAELAMLGLAKMFNIATFGFALNDEIHSLTDDIGRMTNAMKEREKSAAGDVKEMNEWINSGNRMGDTLEELQKRLETVSREGVTNAEVINALGDRHAKVASSVKAHTDNQKALATAMTELNSVGKSFAETVDTIDGNMVEGIKFYTAAGIAQNTLATAYGLTAAQVKAVVEQQKQYAEQLKSVQKIEEDKNASATAGLLSLSRLQQEVSQKSFEAQVRGIDSVEQANKALNDYLAKQTLDEASYEIVKIWEVVDEKEKGYKGDEANRAAYNQAIEALASEQASRVEYIADEAMNHVAKTAVETLDKTADALTARVQSFTNAGTSLPGSSTEQSFGQNFLTSPTGNKVPMGPHGELPGNWFELYSGTSSFSRPFIAPSPRAGGGPVVAGRTYIVGEKQPELFTPVSDGSITPSLNGLGGVSVVNNFYVNGTATDVARQVADKITRSLMDARKLGSV